MLGPMKANTNTPKTTMNIVFPCPVIIRTTAIINTPTAIMVVNDVKRILSLRTVTTASKAEVDGAEPCSAPESATSAVPANTAIRPFLKLLNFISISLFA